MEKNQLASFAASAEDVEISFDISPPTHAWKGVDSNVEADAGDRDAVSNIVDSSLATCDDTITPTNRCAKTFLHDIRSEPNDHGQVIFGKEDEPKPFAISECCFVPTISRKETETVLEADGTQIGEHRSSISNFLNSSCSMLTTAVDQFSESQLYQAPVDICNTQNFQVFANQHANTQPTTTYPTEYETGTALQFERAIINSEQLLPSDVQADAINVEAASALVLVPTMQSTETIDDDFGDFEEASGSTPYVATFEVDDTTGKVSTKNCGEQLSSQNTDAPSAALAPSTADEAVDSIPALPAVRAQPTVEGRLRALVERLFVDESISGVPSSTQPISGDQQLNVYDNEFAAPQRTIWHSTLVVESSPATTFMWQQSRLNLLLLRALKVDTRNLLISSRNIRVVPAYAKGLGTALRPSTSTNDEPGKPILQLELKRAEVDVFESLGASKMKPKIELGSAPNASKPDMSSGLDEFLRSDTSSVSQPHEQSQPPRTDAFASNEAALLEKIRSIKAARDANSNSDAPNAHVTMVFNGLNRVTSYLPDRNPARSAKLIDQ